MSDGLDAPSFHGIEQQPGVDRGDERVRVPVDDRFARAKARLTESQRRTAETLERAAKRLEEAEARANDAEARAEHAAELAELKIQERDRKRPVPQMLIRRDRWRLRLEATLWGVG